MKKSTLLSVEDWWFKLPMPLTRAKFTCPSQRREDVEVIAAPSCITVWDLQSVAAPAKVH